MEERPKFNLKSTPKQESSIEAKAVAEFIDCIMTGAVIAHKMHLRETGQGSYAAHKALNKLYEVLPEHSDTLAEAYQGKAGIILPQVDTVKQSEYLSMNHLEYTEYLIKYVEDKRIVFGSSSTMQNLVDELLADLYSVRYKLKFLS
jgi:DNA-binding ferritin-like protein